MRDRPGIRFLGAGPELIFFEMMSCVTAHFDPVLNRLGGLPH
jgi:hypothetical protein